MDCLDGAGEGGVGGVCGHGCCWWCRWGWRRGQARGQALRLRLGVVSAAVMVGPAGVVVRAVVTESDGMETKEESWIRWWWRWGWVRWYSVVQREAGERRGW